MPRFTTSPLQPSPQSGVYDSYNQANSVHHNQPSNIKCGSFAPVPSNCNYFHFYYGGSSVNSNSYISKVVGKRNMQPPEANGAGYNPHRSSSYDATVYGYGTTVNGAGYGGFGGYANTRAYGNPCGPGAVYAPPGTPRSSGRNQVSSGHVSARYVANTGYEGVVSWNTHGSGGPFSCYTGQPVGIVAGYRNQRCVESEGPYDNQSGYGAVGDHGIGALVGNPTGCGAKSAGFGNINSGGIADYSNAWRSATSQGGGYGAAQSTLYNGGYNFTAQGVFINDLPSLSQGIQKCFGLSKSYSQEHIGGNVNELIEINELVEQSIPIENVQLLETDLYLIDGTVNKDDERAENFKIEKVIVKDIENVIKKDLSFETGEVRESQSPYSDSASLDNNTHFRQSATFVRDIIEDETLHSTHIGTPSLINDLHLFATLKNDEEDRKNFKKIGFSMTRSEAVAKTKMDESMCVHVGHLEEAKAKVDESKGVQVGHIKENVENLVVIPSRKRKASSSTHQDKIFTHKEVIKSRGRCLVELDSYYTSHYDLQDFLTCQKKPKNDKNMRLGVGAENSRHFRMPDEAIHFVRGGTFDSNDCLKFNPPPNFFYRKSKALQDLDWKFLEEKDDGSNLFG